ncbi:molybdate ABC transporter substrate-binding protein [Rubellimicrobium roseum]|uniref:Molybdate ABC transporter substrate-binding protein n=1 Tax=Rubellimicrobium roseum TaxID=687525 RepID=A0A5C4NB82_9RHOB|nr:molybdate ABC transporter substrate-binding protein [Rubellimicrobium roseum]TNC70973.1 molybdate ABC transporter substrate-binding protein [Rubellimicrobium roseum]
MRLALALPALLLATPALADQVTVFAAASLRTALDGIAADWGAANGHEVVLSYAGTPQLAHQIEAGAPADLFLSASTDWMDDLQSKELIVADSRRDLLGNTLVLVAHGEAEPVEIGPGLDLPGLLGDGRLAMALVDSVPAGVYGKEALTTLGLWNAVAPQVAQSENVRAALALVASGEAPLGVVYGSDAVASQAAGEEVSVLGTFPADSHSPIAYPAALVAGRETPAAEAFLGHLASPEARAVFEAQGFTVLD